MSGEKLFVATLENQEAMLDNQATAAANQQTIMETGYAVLAELRGQRPKRYGIRIKDSESNPETRVEYLFDAVGMTPAGMNYATGAFDYGSWGDVWFVKDNFPCMVKSNGDVDYRLNPNDYSKTALGAESDVANTAYDGNAMSAMPTVWVQRYTEGGYRYITFCQFRYDDSYFAHAHTNARGDVMPYAFGPMFEGSTVGSKLRSLSGQAPMNSQSATTEENQANANNSGNARWHIRTWMFSNLIYDLLYLIGKSTNLQETFGQGHSTGGSSAADLMTTGSLNTKGQFFGYSETTKAVKVFHMENFWGDRWEREIGMVYQYRHYKVRRSEAEGSYNFTGEGYNEAEAGIGANGYVTRAKQTELGYFPTAVGGSETTYDCDYHYQADDGTVRVPLVGGDCINGGVCGRYVHVGSAVGAAWWSFGASLFLVPPSP